MGKKSSSKFGDIRLDTTFAILLSGMITRYKSVLKRIGENRNDEVRFGRFIKNPKVTPKRILEHHWSSIDHQFSGRPLLVINDSSTLSFPPNANRGELGWVGPKTNKTGFDIHPSILVDAEHGACYGLGGITIHQTEIARTDEERALKKKKKLNNWKRPFEEKETYKWVASPQQAIENCSGAASYTLLGDRESDIYDAMTRTLEQGWQFIFRSKNDRSLSDVHQENNMFQAIDNWDIKHSYDLELKETKNRTAHTAKVDLKFGSLTIKRPAVNKNKALPQNITLQIVQVKERASTVVGEQAPVHWIILTSHPVNSIDDALQIVQWYQWRWIIEQLFRTLKNKGLNIEASQVETFHGLINLTTMALLAAVQIMQLVQARDGGTAQELNEVFFEQERNCLMKLNKKMEGKSGKLKNPHPPDSLAFGTWIIARLGGWSGYQNNRPPGPITICNGLIRFYDILIGYYLLL